MEQTVIPEKEIKKSSTGNKKINKKDLEWQRKKDSEKVRGIFKFYEVPGGTLKFPYRAYKGDEIEMYEFIDEHIYEIPLGVAKHLNKNGWYPVNTYRLDDNNKRSMHIGKKVHRFGFQSLDFMDLDDSSDNLIEEVIIR